MKPLGDKLKVKLAPKSQFAGEAIKSYESGEVVAVPDQLIYFGFHSTTFDNSLGNDEVLDKVLAFYKKLEGKIVFWEKLQDRGRVFSEDGQDYALINMSDILAYSDKKEHNVTAVDQTGSAGSFNL